MQCWHIVLTAVLVWHFSDSNVLFTCFTCILIYLLYSFNCVLLDFVQSEIYIVFHLRQLRKCTCASLLSIFNTFTQTLNAALPAVQLCVPLLFSQLLYPLITCWSFNFGYPHHPRRALHQLANHNTFSHNTFLVKREPHVVNWELIYV